MTRARFEGLLLLVLGAVVFVWLGAFLDRVEPGPFTDFKELYYSSRCLLQHCDPYNETELRKVYLQEEGGYTTDPPRLQRAVTFLINLPTTFTFVVPISLLPWGPAHVLWFILTASSIILASFLAWDLAADHASAFSGALIGMFLASSAWLLVTGNAAGIVVGFSVIAVWCFLRERFVPIGVVCLATGLAIKPQDSGLIWLYFLLAGGVHRRRAVRSLIVALALGLPGLVLVWHAAPHWTTELRSNIATISARGDLTDPGPSSVTGWDPDSIVNLQTIVSLIRDDPNTYNPPSLLISGILVLMWVAAVLKSKSSPAKDRLAVAAIAALSMLLAYHRQHDAKILLLTFPAFAMLWAEGDMAAWSALGLAIGTVLLNGDLTTAPRVFFSNALIAHSMGLLGLIPRILLARPIPFLLLITGIFYLWTYVRHASARGTPGKLRDFEQEPEVLAPSGSSVTAPSSLGGGTLQ